MQSPHRGIELMKLKDLGKNGVIDGFGTIQPSSSKKPYMRPAKNPNLDLNLNLSGMKRHGSQYANLESSSDEEDDSESSSLDDLEQIGDRGSNYSRRQVQRDIEKIVRILDKVDLGSQDDNDELKSRLSRFTKESRQINAEMSHRSRDFHGSVISRHSGFSRKTGKSHVISSSLPPPKNRAGRSIGFTGT
jgi:hypothetical protein